MKRILLLMQHHQIYFLLALMLLPLGLLAGISVIWVFGFVSLILGLAQKKRQLDAHNPFL